MRGDLVFRIYGVSRGRAKDCYFGAYRSESEARAKVAKLEATEMNGANWAQQYHDEGFVIRTAAVDTDFEIPSLPKPRDEYMVTAARTMADGGGWDTSKVEVFRRIGTTDLEKVCEYGRDYALLHTFEPFRQEGRDYALISRHYTRAAVLDLATGEVIAEEEEPTPGGGFCPVGFYVPDWWDVHDGSVIPGSEHWNADCEWPVGDFGLVWGCHWGDDSSWKVQHLDLRRIREGALTRDDRFGYVELAALGYEPPWRHAVRPAETGSSRPPFIRVSRHDGKPRVVLDVALRFDLESGRLDDTQRRALNGERGVECE